MNRRQQFIDLKEYIEKNIGDEFFDFYEDTFRLCVITDILGEMNDEEFSEKLAEIITKYLQEEIEKENEKTRKKEDL